MAFGEELDDETGHEDFEIISLEALSQSSRDLRKLH